MIRQELDYALKPDAQPFDEIRIRIEPRFKQSELSGDEWRISFVMDFYRNGEVKHTSSCGGSMDVAAGLLYARLIEAQDSGLGYFAGDGIHCDQEGCTDKAAFIFRLKKHYCTGGGKCGQEKKKYGDRHRCFCDKHQHRGNSDLEDNDDNYELVGVL